MPAAQTATLRRGSIDFAMPEGVVKVDEKGLPLRIERVEYDITHQMIEEFMLKANEIVAIHLSEKNRELIYRIHDEPSSETFEDFYTYARALGFTLPSKPTHLDIQKLFEQAKDTACRPPTIGQFYQKHEARLLFTGQYRPLWSGAQTLLSFHQPHPPLHRFDHSAPALQ